jgi:hypothetical protein
MPLHRIEGEVMGRPRTPKPKQPRKKPGPKREMPPGFEEAPMVSMGVTLPREVYQLLTVLSLKRRKDAAFKGKATVSAIISGLILQHLDELKAEAGDYLTLAKFY